MLPRTCGSGLPPSLPALVEFFIEYFIGCFTHSFIMLTAIICQMMMHVFDVRSSQQVNNLRVRRVGFEASTRTFKGYLYSSVMEPPKSYWWYIAYSIRASHHKSCTKNYYLFY